jgi:hypothetical protein
LRRLGPSLPIRRFQRPSRVPDPTAGRRDGPAAKAKVATKRSMNVYTSLRILVVSSMGSSLLVFRSTLIAWAMEGLAGCSGSSPANVAPSCCPQRTAQTPRICGSTCRASRLFRSNIRRPRHSNRAHDSHRTAVRRGARPKRKDLRYERLQRRRRHVQAGRHAHGADNHR